METMFENLAFFKDDNTENGHPFVFVCKDRENTRDGNERWVYCALSEEEAKQVYEHLSIYFN